MSDRISQKNVDLIPHSIDASGREKTRESSGTPSKELLHKICSEGNYFNDNDDDDYSGRRKKEAEQNEKAEEDNKNRGNMVYRMVDGVAEYIIGPGDTIEIIYWNRMDLKTYKIPVRTNGTITIPFLEDFKISGLTTVEADKLLTKEMEKFMRDPKIDVRVIAFKSKKVTVLGSVANKKTGTYYLSGKTRILDLIAMVGGPGPDADLKEIELIQRGETHKINLYKGIFQADLSQNMVLDNEDVIFMPKIPDISSKVYIFGEVESPGIYPFTGQQTVLDIIAKAGGYSKNARLDSVKVVCGDISDPKVISCNLLNIIEKGDFMENVYLLKNDLVYIPRSKITNMKMFVEKVDSLLKLVLYPVALVNTLRDPEDLDLRLDIGY